MEEKNECVERMGARQAQLKYSAAEVTQVSGTIEAALGQGVRCLPVTIIYYLFIFVFLKFYFSIIVDIQCYLVQLFIFNIFTSLVNRNSTINILITLHPMLTSC